MLVDSWNSIRCLKTRGSSAGEAYASIVQRGGRSFVLERGLSMTNKYMAVQATGLLGPFNRNLTHTQFVIGNMGNLAYDRQMRTVYRIVSSCPFDCLCDIETRKCLRK